MFKLKTSNSSSKTCGAAAPRTRITCAYFLGSEEPLLKLSRLAKLQRTNSSPNSNCWHSKSAIFVSRNINSNINSLLRLCVGTHIIYIYIYISIYIYLSDEHYIPEVEMKQPLKIHEVVFCISVHATAQYYPFLRSYHIYTYRHNSLNILLRTILYMIIISSYS